jgi:hypothetical protein
VGPQDTLNSNAHHIRALIDELSEMQDTEQSEFLASLTAGQRAAIHTAWLEFDVELGACDATEAPAPAAYAAYVHATASNTASIRELDADPDTLRELDAALHAAETAECEQHSREGLPAQNDPRDDPRDEEYARVAPTYALLTLQQQTGAHRLGVLPYQQHLQQVQHQSVAAAGPSLVQLTPSLQQLRQQSVAAATEDTHADILKYPPRPQVLSLLLALLVQKVQILTLLFFRTPPPFSCRRFSAYLLY